MVIWLIRTSILVCGSLKIINQQEITDTMNQAFTLNDKFKKRFRNPTSSSMILERLVVYICWVPLIIPALFSGALFHPSNPVRAMFENIFEIELTTTSIVTWTILIFQTYGLICFIGVFMGVSLSVLVVIIICQNWLNGAALKVYDARYYKG